VVLAVVCVLHVVVSICVSLVIMVRFAVHRYSRDDNRLHVHWCMATMVFAAVAASVIRIGGTDAAHAAKRAAQTRSEVVAHDEGLESRAVVSWLGLALADCCCACEADFGMSERERDQDVEMATRPTLSMGTNGICRLIAHTAVNQSNGVPKIQKVLSHIICDVCTLAICKNVKRCGPHDV
jgi:hypothetical protein